jgi:hypothetical protein
VTESENPPKSAPDPRELQDLTNKIVKECVEKILDRLENVQDR